jgi:hypothetical protein
MKVRVLFAFDPALTCGLVYDLHDGEARIGVGDVEAVDKKTEALPDPRVVAAPDAPAAEESAA